MQSVEIPLYQTGKLSAAAFQGSLSLGTNPDGTITGAAFDLENGDRSGCGLRRRRTTVILHEASSAFSAGTMVAAEPERGLGYHNCIPECAGERSTISGDAGPNAGQFSMMSTFVLGHIEQYVESTKHAFQYKTCTLAPSYGVSTKLVPAPESRGFQASEFNNSSHPPHDKLRIEESLVGVTVWFRFSVHRPGTAS
eukprot:COSAG02_NODE_5750_length_4068_cov_1.970522_1_plen_196_part_00